MSTDLTETERLKLGDLELVIEHGLQTFVEVGVALAQIREQKLYRADFSAFEDYCEARWGWKRAHAYRLMDAAAVVEALSPIGDAPLPANEAQARELVPVPEEKRAEVWKDAVEKSGGKPTARDVAEAAKPHRPDRHRNGTPTPTKPRAAATPAVSVRPRPTAPVEPSRDEQDRTSRANAYALIGKVCYFADVVRSEKNIEGYSALLATHPEEFYADQRFKVEQVIEAAELVIERLPQFVDAIRKSQEGSHVAA